MDNLLKEGSFHIQKLKKQLDETNNQLVKNEEQIKDLKQEIKELKEIIRENNKWVLLDILKNKKRVEDSFFYLQPVIVTVFEIVAPFEYIEVIIYFPAIKLIFNLAVPELSVVLS